MNSSWPGVNDPKPFKQSHLDHVNLLADAAKNGEWDEVFRLLDSNVSVSVNQWRIGGKSWFTPLHQAAWLGASDQIVSELIERGAWRSLRSAAGERPADIASERGHHHLLHVLDVRPPTAHEQRRFAAWDTHLANLVSERTKGLEALEIRPVSTEVLVLEQLDDLHFSYPGMYGGFTMSVFKGRLFVESSSRVVGGSGQAHVITEGNCVLVEEGFV